MKRHFHTTSISMIFLIGFILTSCSTRDAADKLFTLQGNTMGTFFTIKIVKDKVLSDQDYNEISLQINDLLAHVNQQMSTWITNSELSLFNQYNKTDWFRVSDELVNVFEHSKKISELSSGAFDITVGPLVNLWGFGPEQRDHPIPSDEEIIQRKKLTGFEKISIQHSPPSVKKETAETYCDLSAIAKGYGVDILAEYLDDKNIANYLIEIGGEIRAKGVNHNGHLWKIGISTPDNKSGIQKVVSINSSSIATSGDYRNYFEKDGVRYSHTIDARTGKPITHKLASVTVIHDTCMIADALATAINVLGPELGYEFALEQELCIFMLVKSGESFIEKMTPEFEKLLSVTN